VEEIPKSASEKNLDRILRDEFRKDAPNVHAYRPRGGKKAAGPA
jgi:hypothetical protein